MAMNERTLAVITPEGLGGLIDGLRTDGFRVIGPKLRDGAIIYDDIETLSDLPAGWTDEQDGGHYRVRRRDDAALFGYNVGPHAWKRFLHPPLLRLWRAERSADGMAIADTSDTAERYAFLAVRSCELHAIGIQDRVFLQGPYVDPHYRARREGAFIIAVNCGDAGGTCFCTSMKTGPKAQDGFDLSVTELLADEHEFLVEVGSKRGAALLATVPNRPPDARHTTMAADATARAEGNQGRHMRSDDVRELLQANLEHPRWDDVAQRCLTCGNCTMVCPTCFCTSVFDENDLATGAAERKRRWDSCFTMDFSYIHGGSVRSSARSRYRQWMTHKLANWVDQFGTSGCVGCGRCITWCPVGIDITEEVRAIRGEGGSDGRA
ncbi:MAG TPA: 4Fe-4S dicluster domain-containing protein [Acetobacteraceae bacterium]|nr:4Fe-4S dicluster domain-containing protein [Acetobacteraceae bacterium]